MNHRSKTEPMCSSTQHAQRKNVTFVLVADSDEENRSFRADDDQNIAERRW
jgi:hypothetical protein